MAEAMNDWARYFVTIMIILGIGQNVLCSCNTCQSASPKLCAAGGPVAEIRLWLDVAVKEDLESRLYKVPADWYA